MQKKAVSICRPFCTYDFSGDVNWEVKRFFNMDKLSKFLSKHFDDDWRFCNEMNQYPTTPGIYYLWLGKMIKKKA